MGFLARRVIEPGTIFTSIASGDYEFLEELPPKIVDGKTIRYGKIRFLTSGKERIVKMSNIFANEIGDKYYPTIAGIGYIGDVSEITYSKKEYDMWRSMISRCYDPKDPSYERYGKIGVSVCDRWHSFENFMTDLKNLPGYIEYYYSGNKSQYSLDKDFKQKHLSAGEKIYSPDTCMLVKTIINSRSTLMNSDNNTTSKYHGLYKLPNGNFQCRIMIDGVDYFLGTYDDEIAAANMYNYFLIGSGVYGDTNEVPLMSASECLKHKTRNQVIKIPPNMHNKDIEEYNAQASFKGITQKSTHYLVEYFVNGKRYNGGKFIDKISAANAYNYYTSLYDTNGAHVLNNVPYMPPSEWIKHKYYGKNDISPVQMTTSTNEPDDVRRARCHAKYGIDLL